MSFNEFVAHIKPTLSPGTRYGVFDPVNGAAIYRGQISKYNMPILNERNKVHGNFDDNARISQRLKNLIREELRACGTELTAIQLEALDMDCCKTSRIISGNPNEPDHWQDKAGYAMLVYESLTKK